MSNPKTITDVKDKQLRMLRKDITRMLRKNNYGCGGKTCRTHLAGEACGWRKEASPLAEVQLGLLIDKVVRLQQSENITILLEMFVTEALSEAGYDPSNETAIGQVGRTLVFIFRFF